MKKKIPKNRKCGNLFLELEKGKIGENGKLQENIENPKNVIYNIIILKSKLDGLNVIYMERRIDFSLIFF